MRKPRHFKLISILLCALFIFEQSGLAQAAPLELNISSHLSSVSSSFAPDKFRPVHLRGLTCSRINNDFILSLDKGDGLNLGPAQIESVSKDLLNYFLVGISLPNTCFWVNLRPDAPQDIIDPFLAQTEVGRILLEADLALKKDTADATSPQTKEGREYWDKLYRKAAQIYGTQNVTIPTLVRPWIVPSEIIIRESSDTAYIYKATLKVMLEQDYLKGSAAYAFKDDKERQLNEYSAQIIREDILPKLNKQINSAKRYAALRQVYYSLILAQWYKARHQDKNTEYARKIDRQDLTGLYAKNSYAVAAYFSAYQENFTKGQYNIKEPVSTPYGQVIRSYFSGGIADIAPVIPGKGGPKQGAVELVPAVDGVNAALDAGADAAAFTLALPDGHEGKIIVRSQETAVTSDAVVQGSPAGKLETAGNLTSGSLNDEIGVLGAEKLISESQLRFDRSLLKQVITPAEIAGYEGNLKRFGIRHAGIALAIGDADIPADIIHRLDRLPCMADPAFAYFVTRAIVAMRQNASQVQAAILRVERVYEMSRDLSDFIGDDSMGFYILLTLRIILEEANPARFERIYGRVCQKSPESQSYYSNHLPEIKNIAAFVAQRDINQEANYVLLAYFLYYRNVKWLVYENYRPYLELLQRRFGISAENFAPFLSLNHPEFIEQKIQEAFAVGAPLGEAARKKLGEAIYRATDFTVEELLADPALLRIYSDEIAQAIGETMPLVLEGEQAELQRLLAGEGVAQDKKYSGTVANLTRLIQERREGLLALIHDRLFSTLDALEAAIRQNSELDLTVSGLEQVLAQLREQLNRVERLAVGYAGQEPEAIEVTEILACISEAMELLAKTSGTGFAAKSPRDALNHKLAALRRAALELGRQSEALWQVKTAHDLKRQAFEADQTVFITALNGRIHLAESLLAGITYVKGQGIEKRLLRRVPREMKLGDIFHDCIGMRLMHGFMPVTNVFWTLAPWLMNGGYQVVEVLDNGNPVAKQHAELKAYQGQLVIGIEDISFMPADVAKQETRDHLMDVPTRELYLEATLGWGRQASAAMGSGQVLLYPYIHEMVRQAGQGNLYYAMVQKDKTPKASQDALNESKSPQVSAGISVLTRISVRSGINSLKVIIKGILSWKVFTPVRSYLIDWYSNWLVERSGEGRNFTELFLVEPVQDIIAQATGLINNSPVQWYMQWSRKPRWLKLNIATDSEETVVMKRLFANFVSAVAYYIYSNYEDSESARALEAAILAGDGKSVARILSKIDDPVFTNTLRSLQEASGLNAQEFNWFVFQKYPQVMTSKVEAEIIIPAAKSSVDVRDDSKSSATVIQPGRPSFSDTLMTVNRLLGLTSIDEAEAQEGVLLAIPLSADDVFLSAPSGGNTATADQADLRVESVQSPSISSTGFGDEHQANRNILDGILKIAVQQGVITQAERQRRLVAFDANAKAGLDEDLDLTVDGQNVYLINGQMVVVIDAPYLSVTEAGEQSVSAGLRRGVIYITRQRFRELNQEQLEETIRHEQAEVNYLRQKAREMFPGLDEATAYELFSNFLKNPQNQQQAQALIQEAHQYAILQAPRLSRLAAIDAAIQSANQKDSVFYTTTLIDLLKELSFADQVDIFVRLLRNDYRLDTRQRRGLLGNQTSPWEDVLALVENTLSQSIEILPYIIPLLNDPLIPDRAKSHIWKVLRSLAYVDIGALIGSLNAAGLTPEMLVEMALTPFREDRQGETEVASILYTLLNSRDNNLLPVQRSYAQLVLALAQRYLSLNRSFDTMLIEMSLELTEQAMPSDQLPLGQDRAAAARNAYVEQIMAMNEIFQQAMEIIYAHPDISYQELFEALLSGQQGKARYTRLSRKQRIALRTLLIRNRADRIALKQKFEQDKRNYPIDAFNDASRELMELYRQRKALARARDNPAIRQINRRIAALRSGLRQLRSQIAPYLESECGLAIQDAPQVAIIELGPLGLEIHVDYHSLQKVMYSRPPSKEGVVQRSYLEDMMFNMFGKKNIRIDANALRDLLRQFPYYLYRNFQNEMVAYLTGAELRYSDPDDLLDYYFQYYSYQLFEYIKKEKWFAELGIPESQLRAYLEEGLNSREWQQVKTRLKAAKKLLDDLVDIKATLIYQELLAQGAPGSQQELKDIAYQQAALYVMGLFQLVPILKIDRLTVVLEMLKAELQAKGISASNILRVMPQRSRNRQGGIEKQTWAGAAGAGVVWTIFRGGDRVINHERQHVVYGQYTGAEAERYTPGFNDFQRLLSDAVYGKPQLPPMEQPVGPESESTLEGEEDGNFMGSSEQVTTGNLDYLGEPADKTASAVKGGVLADRVILDPRGEVDLKEGTVNIAGIEVGVRVDNHMPDLARIKGGVVVINLERLNLLLKDSGLDPQKKMEAVMRFLAHELAETVALRMGYAPADAHVAGMMAEAMISKTPEVRAALSPILGQRDELDALSAENKGRYLAGASQPYTNAIANEVAAPLLVKEGPEDQLKILEVGSGSGALSVAAALQDGTSLVIGLDPDPNNVLLAGRVRKFAGNLDRIGLFDRSGDVEGRVEELESSQAAPEPIANVEFREGSATRIPFGDNSFNRIIYFDVDAFIFNASDKVKAIQEILRVIDKQKGGLIHARPKASAREKDLQDFIALFNTEAARMGVKLDYRITRFSDSGIGVLFIIRPPSLAGGPVAQGGIDLRSLPIVTQSVNHLKADIRSMSVSNLQRLDLSSELLDIQRLVSSGIVPSVERIKEFFAAGCLKGALPADAKKVTSCIASILRTQEQSCELTNPALKDILVVLNSGGNLEEFKLILAR